MTTVQPGTPEHYRLRIENLLDLALDECEKILRTGTTALKMSVLRQVIPALVKAIGEPDATDELAEMREELRRLYEMITARPEPTFTEPDLPPVDGT